MYDRYCVIVGFYFNAKYGYVTQIKVLYAMLYLVTECRWFCLILQTVFCALSEPNESCMVLILAS